LGGDCPQATTDTATIVNSTFAENVAFNQVTGEAVAEPAATGGGIYNKWVTLDMKHSTVSKNTAKVADTDGFALGAGIYLSPSLCDRPDPEPDIDLTFATLNHTISAANSFTGSSGQNVGIDVNGEFETASKYNFIGIGLGASGFDDATNIVGTETNPERAGLAALEDNGGPTWTMELSCESAPVDQGTSSNTIVEWDQRGDPYHRLVNDNVDIGAYELQTSCIPPPDFPAPHFGFDHLPLNASIPLPHHFDSTDAPRDDGHVQRESASVRRGSPTPPLHVTEGLPSQAESLFSPPVLPFLAGSETLADHFAVFPTDFPELSLLGFRIDPNHRTEKEARR
jgi:hypothetical protein